jgi:hypothetical protein
MLKTKNLRLNKAYLLALGLAGLTVLLVFSGCTAKEEADFVEKYGHSNAYCKHNGKEVTLLNNSADYYVGNVTGDYKMIAEYSCSKANALPNINITAKGNSSSNFSFATVNGVTATKAVNKVWISQGELFKSTITYYTVSMDKLTLDGKKHVAIHEMGHTLGLDDLKTPDLRPYSVMYYAYGKRSKYTFSDYQAFDKENIAWKYGE